MVSKKRINVSFTLEQINILRSLNGIMGNSDAEIIRNITLSWLSEKNLLTQKFMNNSNFGTNINSSIKYGKKSKEIKNKTKSEEIITRLIK